MVDYYEYVDVNEDRKQEFKQYDRRAEVEMVSANRVRVYLDNAVVPMVIGREGKNINALQDKLGISIDIEPKTVEAIIVRIADAISGSRPGARRDSHENYVKRITELENIAKSFTGVDKAFAVHAGREIRILVRPTDVSDLDALRLAKDIARKVEQDMQYPGMIKVNVIRETRAQEFAK